MEIAINDQFGGFSLSHEAVMRYAELKGMKLYPWIDDISKKVYGDKATLDNPSVCIHYTTVPQERYEEINEREMKKPVRVGRFAKSNALYFSDRDIARNDPLLLQVIRELKTKADGQCATLKIVTIPDGVDWQIEEYDGAEHIAEKHRTWE